MYKIKRESIDNAIRVIGSLVNNEDDKKFINKVREKIYEILSGRDSIQFDEKNDIQILCNKIDEEVKNFKLSKKVIFELNKLRDSIYSATFPKLELKTLDDYFNYIVDNDYELKGVKFIGDKEINIENLKSPKHFRINGISGNTFGFNIYNLLKNNQKPKRNSGIIVNESKYINTNIFQEILTILFEERGWIVTNKKVHKKLETLDDYFNYIVENKEELEGVEFIGDKKINIRGLKWTRHFYINGELGKDFGFKIYSLLEESQKPKRSYGDFPKESKHINISLLKKILTIIFEERGWLVVDEKIEKKKLNTLDEYYDYILNNKDELKGVSFGVNEINITKFSISKTSKINGDSERFFGYKIYSLLKENQKPKMKSGSLVRHFSFISSYMFQDILTVLFEEKGWTVINETEQDQLKTLDDYCDYIVKNKEELEGVEFTGNNEIDITNLRRPCKFIINGDYGGAFGYKIYTLLEENQKPKMRNGSSITDHSFITIYLFKEMLTMLFEERGWTVINKNLSI